MRIEFEFHPEVLLVLPLLLIGHGECENPQCNAEHWVIALGWIVWDISLFIETGGGAAS